MKIQQKFCQAQIPLYCRNIKFGEINFANVVKVTNILYVIINTGQKIRVIKILPMRAGGEIVEIFLLAKISAYMVLARLYIHNPSLITPQFKLACTM